MDKKRRIEEDSTIADTHTNKKKAKEDSDDVTVDQHPSADFDDPATPLPPKEVLDKLFNRIESQVPQNDHINFESRFVVKRNSAQPKVFSNNRTDCIVQFGTFVMWDLLNVGFLHFRGLCHKALRIRVL
jgi:hypothetical protein